MLPHKLYDTVCSPRRGAHPGLTVVWFALQTARDRRAENRRKNQAAKRQAALAEKRSVRGNLLVCLATELC